MAHSVHVEIVHGDGFSSRTAVNLAALVGEPGAGYGEIDEPAVDLRRRARATRHAGLRDVRPAPVDG